MVRFLLENSLGAWWAARHPDSPLLARVGVPALPRRRHPGRRHLRGLARRAPPRSRSWTPAAARATSSSPPPTCSAGCARRRRASPTRAGRRRRPARQPLRPRARRPLHPARRLRPRPRRLEGRRLPRRCRSRTSPAPGIAIKGQLDDWRRLAGGDERPEPRPRPPLRPVPGRPRARLASSTRGAPSARASGRSTLDAARSRKLDQALQRRRQDPAAAVFGAAAAGTAKAAQLLAGRYWLVATNPPFLGRGKQSRRSASLTSSVTIRHAKTTWRRLCIDRVMLAARRGGHAVTWSRHRTGSSSSRMRLATAAPPRRSRRRLLMVAALGRRGLRRNRRRGRACRARRLAADQRTRTPRATCLDASRQLDAAEKAMRYCARALLASFAVERYWNAGCAHRFRRVSRGSALLAEYAASTGRASARATARASIGSFWEMPRSRRRLGALAEQRPIGHEPYGGREHVVLWEDGEGDRSPSPSSTGLTQSRTGARQAAWGSAVSLSARWDPAATLYAGDTFDDNAASLVPDDPDDLPALWAFCVRPDASQTAVRRHRSRSSRSPTPPSSRFPSTSSTGRRSPPSSTPTACPSPTATTRPSGCSRATSSAPRRRSRSPSPACSATAGPTRSPTRSTSSPTPTASSACRR